MGIGMNTEFMVILTPKDDKAVYSQKLSMPIHLKEDLIVKHALMHKYGIITVLPFSENASPIFAWRKPNGKLLIADDYTNNNHPVTLCQMQHNAWQGSHYSASLIAPKLTTACRWRTNVRWNFLHSILSAEPLPTKDLSKVSADLCLLFQASCSSTWTQLSKLTNVLNTWTPLELQLITQRILPETLGHSPGRIEIDDTKRPFWRQTS